MPRREHELRKHIRKIERDAKKLDRDASREFIIGVFGELEGRTAEVAKKSEEFDKNLNAATVSGALGFAGFTAAGALARAGHNTAASGALKFALSAMVPYAYFGIGAWKAATDLRKLTYKEAYPWAKERVKKLDDRELARWAMHAAAARKTMDPELEARATALLHAATEEMLRRGLLGSE